MSHGESGSSWNDNTSEETILDGRYILKEALIREKGKILFAGVHQYTQRQVRIFRYDTKIYDWNALEMQAKALGDFSGLSGLCSVIDTIETDPFFFIILEEAKGEPLRTYCMEKEKLPMQQLAEKLLVLVSCFKKLEAAGVNDLFLQEIYVSEHGDFSIFPAFESRKKGSGDYCYDICEIFYICRSRKIPQARILRLLFDEMQPLEKADPQGDARLHQIMEKGMSVDPDQNDTSMQELEDALKEWLEEQKPQPEQKHSHILKRAVLCLACLFLVIGICRVYREKLYFLGTETETLLLVPDEHMTRIEYKKAVPLLKEEIAALSRKRYITEKDGKIRVVLPWKTYQEKKSELETKLQEDSILSSFHLTKEHKADWTVQSYLKAKNWVDAEKIKEPSVTLEYAPYVYDWLGTEEDSWNKTKGTYYHTLIDFSARLEKLAIPYAIGISREDNRHLLIRVEQKNMSVFLSEILASHIELHIEDTWGNSLLNVSGISLQKTDNGYELCVQSEYENIPEETLKDQTLYLILESSTGKYALAERPPSPLKAGEESQERSGTYLFPVAEIGESESLSETQQPLIEMLDIAQKAFLYESGFELIDVQYGTGSRLSSESRQEKTEYSLRDDNKTQLLEKMAEILPDAEVEESDDLFLDITMHMELDGAYAETVSESIRKLLQECISTTGYYSYDTFTVWAGEKNTSPELYLSKNADQKQWEMYYRSNDSEEEQKLKKKLQKIADENKIAWKGW